MPALVMVHAFGYIYLPDRSRSPALLFTSQQGAGQFFCAKDNARLQLFFDLLVTKVGIESCALADFYLTVKNRIRKPFYFRNLFFRGPI